MAFNQRHDAREATIQFLMHCEVNGKLTPESVTLEDETGFWEMRPAMRKVRILTMELARGVLGERTDLDERIQRNCHNYLMARMNAVDRNVLRLAVYEMFHRLEVPPVVALNEAIEIAKRYGTDDSGRFVNGVLDQVKREVTRPWRTAVEPERAADDAPAPASGESAKTPASAKASPSPEALVVDDLF